MLRVVRVSGTICKVEEEAIKRARGDILRARREGGEGGGLLIGGGFGIPPAARRGDHGILGVDEEQEEGIMDMDSEEGESEDG